ncbi:MAG: HNH endonuclease signature motif containing protein, partial [Janthinobacterium lividum]
GALAKAEGFKAVHLVAGSPAAWQRQFWIDKLGATIVLLDPGKEHALIGARDIGIPERFVHQWYAEAATSAPPRAIPATTERESAAKRGYGNEHRVVRDRQLAREPWCRFHWEEQRVKIPATVLDHIKPFRSAEGVFDGKLWGDPANHRSLCQPCHDARGATRSRAEKPPGAGADGRPLDPKHPWSKA